MRTTLLVLVWMVVTGSSTLASAQETLLPAQHPPADERPVNVREGEIVCWNLKILDESCLKEFDDWWTLELKWREWKSERGSRPRGQKYIADYLNKIVTVRPSPPWWIEPYCYRVSQSNEFDTRICVQYADYLAYDWTQHVLPEKSLFMTLKRVAARATEYDEFWSWFLRNLHYDFGWIPAKIGGAGFQGIAGVHFTLAQFSDRLYVFGPGVMVNVRRDGSYRIGKTWGLSFRLTDFSMFSQSKNFRLFINVANMRFDGLEEMAETDGVKGETVIGLSFALNK